MTNTPMPVDGSGTDKGAPDGVSASPGGDHAQVHGRTAGGESGGGAYQNPHTGTAPSNSGVMGHGGQTDIAYHGGGQAGDGGDAPNAATGSDGGEGAGAAWAAPTYAPHEVISEGRTFGVIETNGVAEAEATGKIGTEAPYEREQEKPGSG